LWGWIANEMQLILLLWHVFRGIISINGVWEHYISGKFWDKKNTNLAHSTKESFLHLQKNGLIKYYTVPSKIHIFEIWNQWCLRRIQMHAFLALLFVPMFCGGSLIAVTLGSCDRLRGVTGAYLTWRDN
jgi:hypothetical protein